jgi:RHS repeat-associated protein
VVAQRYAYNGKELVEGIGLYDYGARWYDPVVGRWTSVDPLAGKFVSESPYNYAGNSPVMNIDVGGAYKLPAHFIQKYPHFARYLQNNVKNDVMSSGTIMSALQRHSSGNLTRGAVENAVTWGQGPTINIVDAPGGLSGAHGYYSRGSSNALEKVEGTISLNVADIDALEAALAGDGSDMEKLTALTNTYMTLLHETVHYGDYLDGSRQDGGEPGDAFEIDVWSDKVLNDDGSIYKDETGNTYPAVRFLSSHYDSPEQMLEMVRQYLNSDKLPAVPE